MRPKITHVTNVFFIHQIITTMSKYYFIVLVMTGILFSGCSDQNPEFSAGEKSLIEKQILDQWEKISAAIENSDSEGFAAFISPDLIVMSSNGLVFYSKTAYIDKVRNWFSGRRSTEIQPDKIIVTALGEDIALLDQQSDFRVTYQDDSIQRVNHAVSFVFKREPSGWMIIHGHESFVEMK